MAYLPSAVIRVEHPLAILLCATIGCGRVSFDPVDDAGQLPSTDATAVPLCSRFSDALYCNDFDTGQLFGAEFRGMSVDFTPSGVNSTPGYATTAVPGEIPRLWLMLPSPVTAGPLHIGAQILFEAGPATQDYVVIVQALAPAFEKISFDMTSNDRLQVVTTVVSSSTQGPANSFTRGVWMCVELVIVVGSSGSSELFINGASRLMIPTINTLPPGGFTVLELGAESSSSNTTAVTVHVDNVVVRTSSIGCP